LKRKKGHIDKYLSAKLPEPDVTADDAWTRMNDMLEQASISNIQKQPTDSKGINSLKTIITASILITIAFMLWFFLAKDESNLNKENLKRDGITNSVSRKNNTKANKNFSKQMEIIQSQLDANLTDNNTLSVSNKRAENSELDKFEKSLNPSLPISLKNGLEKAADRNFSIDSIQNSHIKLNREKAVSSSPGVSENIKEDHNSHNINPDISQKNSRLRSITKEKIASKIQKISISNPSQGRNLNPTIRQIKQSDFEFNRVKLTAEMLRPRSITLNPSPKNMQFSPIKAPGNKAVHGSSSEKNNSFYKNIHVGPEWNIGSAFNNRQHALAKMSGSLNPYLTLVPGIWLNYTLSKRQSVSVNVIPFHSYLGGLKNLAQIREFTSDSIPWRDSIVSYRTIKLVKANGVNIAFQYNYHFSSKISVAVGLSFNSFSSALIKESIADISNIAISDTLTIRNRNNINQYLRKDLFALKTGLTISPGKYEFGINLLLPMQDMSSTSTNSLKPLNGQLFFRWKIK
jgi:hypothetical protein